MSRQLVNTALYFVQQVLLLALSWSVLPVSATVDHRCSFPDFLVDRPRWETHVKMERRVIGAVWTFSSESAQLANMSVHGGSQTTYSCESALSNTTILVSASTSGNSDSATSQFVGYQCFRFVRRHANVVQMAKSKMKPVRDVGLCAESALLLDEFPLVWPRLEDAASNTEQEAGSEYGADCGLVGGYMFTLADSDGTRICAGAFLQPIIESDCSGRGEGIAIDFRQLNCMGELSLDVVTRLYCLGAWSDAKYTYSVVTDRNELWPKLWLLRLPVSPPVGRSFVGHIRTDITTAAAFQAKTSVTAGNKMYTLHVTPASFPSLCEDEATGCDASRCADDDYYGGAAEVHCQKTCRACANDSMSSSCKFTDRSLGVWNEMSSEHGRRVIAIEQSSMTVGDSPSAVCLELNADKWFSGSNRHPIATVFSTTGCRPRLACIEFHRRSAAVLTYRVGRRIQWPHPSLPLKIGDLCGDSMFDADTTKPAQKASHFRAVVKAGDVTSLVACDLQGWIQLAGRLSSGSNLTARVDTCGQDPNSFRYTFRQSEGDKVDQTVSHRCLAAFTDLPSGDKYLITVTSSTSGRPDDAYCWLFQRTVWETRPRLYLTLASDCNADTGVDVQYRGSSAYIAQFDVISPSTSSALTHDCKSLTPGPVQSLTPGPPLRKTPGPPSRITPKPTLVQVMKTVPAKPSSEEEEDAGKTDAASRVTDGRYVIFLVTMASVTSTVLDHLRR